MKKLFAVCTLVISSFAFANQHMGHHGACKEDIKKFCGDMKKGEGEMAQCLKTHEAELSPACKEQHAENKEMRQDFMKACKMDLKTHCKGVKMGGGAKMQCLKDKESMLSEACKAELSKDTPATKNPS